MNQRAELLIQERVVKTRAVSALLGKAAGLYHEIMASTRELAEIARDSNPDRKVFVRETLSTIGADRLHIKIESALKSLMAHEPPVDFMAECAKGNLTLLLTINRKN